MRTIQAAGEESYPRMTSGELRSHFVIEDLFVPGRAEFVYTNVDRAVVGGLIPMQESLALTGGREMACSYFCERREAGVINLGAPGMIRVDGVEFRVGSRECLYIGRGSREILFSSERPESPAQFYLVSYPAHADYPTTFAGLDQANRIDLGAPESANRRTIFQFIRPGRIQSCQLVMGYTELIGGSVWNTFPPHTHDRRTEVYCYFDIPQQGCVFHLLGKPEETRHVVMREKQAVLAPPWSVHSGVGSGSYRFVWAMGGENQVFEDMDQVQTGSLR
jgi:4-deoxy-L-threo-5-hexosulose-uronate ketol-isomerase